MRRTLFFSLLTVLIVSATPAQMKLPDAKDKAMDTSLVKKTPPTEKTEQTGMAEGVYHREYAGPSGEKMEMYGPDNRDYWHYGTKGMKHMWSPMGHHMFRSALLVLTCLFIFLLINILLTILVTLDMARRRQFTGLWIPVLLLMGIPGTALYALFRIGDLIAAKELKPQ